MTKITRKYRALWAAIRLLHGPKARHGDVAATAGRAA